MYRVFEDDFSLSEKNKHHLLNVVRIAPDEEFEIVVKKKVYRAVFDKELKILREVLNSHETRVPITLYMALIKQDKFELVLEKATEIGVSKIVPLILKRTVVNIKNKEDKKIARWQKIVESAAKQSKRDIIPEVLASVELKDISSNGTIIVPYEKKEEIYIRDVLTEKVEEVSIVIGPEGGFETFEIEYLENLGAKIVTLGNRILRAETAAICASYEVATSEVIR